MARKRTTPAERARAFEREHGITAEQRRRGSGLAALVFAAVLAVGVVLLGLSLPLVGITTHGDVRGHGTVTIEGCRASGLVRQCSGLVRDWQGEGPSPGERIDVLARTPLVGTVEVVMGTRTISSTNKQQGTDFHEAALFVPAADWVMPQWLRPVYFVAVGLLWLVLGWWAAQATAMGLVRRQARRRARVS